MARISSGRPNKDPALAREPEVRSSETKKTNDVAEKKNDVGKVEGSEAAATSTRTRVKRSRPPERAGAEPISQDSKGQASSNDERFRAEPNGNIRVARSSSTDDPLDLGTIHVDDLPKPDPNDGVEDGGRLPWPSPDDGVGSDPGKPVRVPVPLDDPLDLGTIHVDDLPKPDPNDGVEDGGRLPWPSPDDGVGSDPGKPVRVPVPLDDPLDLGTIHVDDLPKPDPNDGVEDGGRLPWPSPDDGVGSDPGKPVRKPVPIEVA